VFHLKVIVLSFVLHHHEGFWQGNIAVSDIQYYADLSKLIFAMQDTIRSDIADRDVQE